MTYRFYFWFQGVPKNRSAGPWWSRDFNTLEKMIDFKKAMLPFLHAHAIDNQNTLYFSSDGKDMYIPPQNLTVTYTDGI